MLIRHRSTSLGGLGWGLDARGLEGGLGCRKEMAQLVEKQTGGKQVPWPVLDAELRAESPGGLGTPLSLQTSVIERSGEQTREREAALGPLKCRTESLASKGS